MQLLIYQVNVLLLNGVTTPLLCVQLVIQITLLLQTNKLVLLTLLRIVFWKMPPTHLTMSVLLASPTLEVLFMSISITNVFLILQLTVLKLNPTLPSVRSVLMDTLLVELTVNLLISMDVRQELKIPLILVLSVSLDSLKKLSLEEQTVDSQFLNVKLTLLTNKSVMLVSPPSLKQL